MQFWTGDYYHDTAQCTPSTRGIWMDILIAMHNNDRSGILTGTRDGLARIARCSPVDIDHALTELLSLKVAEVRYRNDIVKVINRRMYRLKKEREQAKNRINRYREKTRNANVTHKKHSCNANVTTHIQKQKQKQKQKEENTLSPDTAEVVSSPHRVFSNLWVSGYKHALGRKYKFEGARDGKAIKTLLTTGATPEELIEIAKSAWSRIGGFWCKHAATIHGFETQFNNIVTEIYNELKPASTNGKSDQRSRAEYDGAGLPTRRAELTRLLYDAGFGRN